MNRRPIGWCVLGAMALASGAAPPPREPVEPVELVEQDAPIEPANEDPRWLNATLVSGRVEFEPPEPIDWEVLAPSGLVGFPLSEAEPGFVSALDRMRDMFGNATLSFEAPLPSSLQDRFFYFVSPDGVQELRVDRLRGIVRFGLAEDGRPLSRVLYGYAVASAVESGPLAPAGFVLGLPRSAAFDVRESSHEARMLAPQSVRGSWESLTETDHAFWSVRKQYALRLAGTNRSWTFVQWSPDEACHEACCAWRLNIVEGADAPRIIASHSTGCDI